MVFLATLLAGALLDGAPAWAEVFRAGRAGVLLALAEGAFFLLAGC
ncbi:MAG TPA: hypothetical protein VFH49_03390 [Aquabacterium sp.]|nr:hypothetical protein [Aquabacterium sp.]